MGIILGVNLIGTFKDKMYFRIYNQLKSKSHNFHISNKIHLKNTGGGVKGNEFYFSGVRNKIIIDKAAQISNVKFEIIGEDNEIRIGKGVILRNSIIHVGDRHSRLIIKDSVDVGVDAKWTVLEGAKVQIGKGCMFSTNSHILSSDSHSIVKLSSNIRENKAANIIIGERVWFGEDVTCLKGSIIESDSIFGCKSLITAGKYKKNAVYAGVPCKKIKENIYWEVKRI